MKRKLESFFIKVKSIFMQLCSDRGGAYLNYCIENNAGDSFNKVYLEKEMNIKVNKYTFGSLEHYLFCGSIISRCNKNSIIIGAGLISEDRVFGDFKKVIGCRGYKSLSLLRKKKNFTPEFIGDPGLLVKEHFKNIDKPRKKFKIGIIPHFIDFELVKKFKFKDESITIIDIKQDHISVCNEILECDFIVSSSLHGLIFSDALSVKNLWVVFSDKIIGGSFKFEDYYSAMENGHKRPIKCKSFEDIVNNLPIAGVAINPNYKDMKISIEKEFGKF